MATDHGNIKEKRQPKFAYFGEYLFWSYANSSKGNMDLYATVRKEWPPLNILIHYLKNIYLYSVENGLMDKHAEEMDAMELPFKWQYIPIDYPQPEVYM